MRTSFNDAILASAFHDLDIANKTFAAVYPGESPERQPVHTLYGGAQLFKATTISRIGELAIQHFDEFAPDHRTLMKAFSVSSETKRHDDLWRTVFSRVRERLKKCAVEDFRIDFEDGYGNRPDAEEDSTAAFTALEVASGMSRGELSPFIGIRIKPFTQELKRRSARTLDIFVTTLLQATNGKLPDNFVITLPKVSLPEQVSACVILLEHLEQKHRLPPQTLKIEIMTETTQGIIAADGSIAVPKIFAAAKGRCRGAHFGTYDYTASCGITAAHQRMDHPACDFALLVMKNALGGTGIWLSTGATSIMPVPIHRAEKGATLTKIQEQENRENIHKAWKISYDHIMHSLVQGYYQGWDLHPGQLGVRYAACYAFFLEGLEQASARLKNFMEKAAQATLVGDVFDDAATGQGLLNYFLQALGSGAISEAEIEAAGLSLAEVRTKSFVAILKGRAK